MPTFACHNVNNFHFMYIYYNMLCCVVLCYASYLRMLWHTVVVQCLTLLCELWVSLQLPFLDGNPKASFHDMVTITLRDDNLFHLQNISNRCKQQMWIAGVRYNFVFVLKFKTLKWIDNGNAFMAEWHLVSCNPKHIIISWVQNWREKRR